MITLFACIAFAHTSGAQDNEAGGKTITSDKVYTSLKPNDVQPYVFNSKEELSAKFQNKKDGIINLIKNENDPVKIKLLREELWRLENAIIQEPRK